MNSAIAQMKQAILEDNLKIQSQAKQEIEMARKDIEQKAHNIEKVSSKFASLMLALLTQLPHLSPFVPIFSSFLVAV